MTRYWIWLAKRGAVSKEVVKIMGNNDRPHAVIGKDMPVGIDISRSALSIAKASASPYSVNPFLLKWTPKI
jgi:hypothetical protein